MQILLLNIQKKASVSTYEAWSFGEKLQTRKKKKKDTDYAKY
jgi:hypothetical protein